MGACATKPKVLKPEDGESPAPAPETPVKVESKDVSVSVSDSVNETEKKVDVAFVEVVKKGNNNEIEIVDDPQLNLKSRSLSHLFQEKEEIETTKYETKAVETELLGSKETEKYTEDVQPKGPQTVEIADVTPPSKEPDEKRTDGGKSPEKVEKIEVVKLAEATFAIDESKASEKKVEDVVNVEKIGIVTPKTIESESLPSVVILPSKTPEEKRTEDVKSPEKVEKIELVKLVEATTATDGSKTSENKTEDVVDVVKIETEAPKKIESESSPSDVKSLEKVEKIEPVKLVAATLATEGSNKTTEKKTEDVVVTVKIETETPKKIESESSLSNVTPPSTTPEEKRTVDIKSPEKVEKIEPVKLVEATQVTDGSKTSEKKIEDVVVVAKIETETPKKVESEPTPSIESGSKPEVKATGDEKVKS